MLALALGLRLWRLEDNGFGTEYYAAGVRSALQSAALFFYNAFDPAGFISLDKPPVAFWIQTGFARLLGFSGWSIHLPQALAGTASVAIVYRLVRHPIYLALLGMLLGNGLVFARAWWQVAVAVLLYVVGTRLRIHAEDELLRERLVSETLGGDGASSQLERLASEVATKKRDPYSAVDELMKR